MTAVLLILCVLPSFCVRFSEAATLVAVGSDGKRDDRGLALVRKSDAGARTDAAAKGTGWAIIIGINNYVDTRGIGKLKFCENDARALYDRITKTGGFPRENCRLLLGRATDPTERPTRSNLYSVFTAWLSLAKKRDIALVYFAGHGIESERKTYLLPQDARVTNPELTGIPLGHIKDFLRKSKAERKVLIVDACHSGEGRDLSTMRTRWTDHSKGLVCITSCDIGQKSYEYDAKYHGAFTWFLNAGLGGAADGDGDGFIRASELNFFVGEKVQRWAAERGLTQSPRFVADVIGDPVLAWCPRAVETPPAAPTAAARVPAAPVRDPNRFDIIVLKTGRLFECEAFEVGDRVVFKRAGMKSSFARKHVQEIRYGVGRRKDEVRREREERRTAAKKVEQGAVWQTDWLQVRIISARFIKKGGNAGRVVIAFRFTNTRADGADIRRVYWCHGYGNGLVITPDQGSTQTLTGYSGLRAHISGRALVHGVPHAFSVTTNVFATRPLYLSISFKMQADGFGTVQVKFPSVAVTD